MITPGYCRLMSRYNIWQNQSLYREADRLSEAQRREDRGAFFRSVHGTLSHLLWGDTMWMSRFDGWSPPEAIQAASADWIEWPDLKRERKAADTRIAGWTETIEADALARTFPWTSSTGAKNSKPLWVLVTHFFNHQTHHRGQVHALLTGFGRKPDATDLPWMPDA